MKRKQQKGIKIFKLLFYWIPFICYFTLIPPSALTSFLGFYSLLSISLFYTFKTFFSLGRTLVWLGIILLYLILRQLHLDNILNIIIIVGILITFEIYFRKV